MGCADVSPVKKYLSHRFEDAECIEGHASAAMYGLTLKEKLFSWGGDFHVKDESGNMVYKVKGAVMTLRDKKTMLHADGSIAAVIQVQLMACPATYQIYRTKPNMEG